MIADQPALRILIFILLEIQHQIITVSLGWNTFPHSIKREAIILSGTPEAVGLKGAQLSRREGGAPQGPAPRGEIFENGKGWLSGTAHGRAAPGV